MFKHFAVLAAPVALSTLLSVAPLRADGPDQTSSENSIEIVVSGFQASSSSPFILRGDQIGTGAIWRHLVGPIVGTTFAFIPSAPGFDGAACLPEYSRDQIVTQDGSTITVNVFGTRCEPASSPGAHSTIGVYSFVSGTGRFQHVTAGTGPVTIDVHADGSASIHIGGFLRVCTGGACGS